MDILHTPEWTFFTPRNGHSSYLGMDIPRTPEWTFCTPQNGHPARFLSGVKDHSCTLPFMDSACMSPAGLCGYIRAGASLRMRTDFYIIEE
ncbi:MAG: hypothetical protein K6G18_11415 [Treponema sp.]|nr:hypothetical protein [Treponema sp.]